MAPLFLQLEKNIYTNTQLMLNIKTEYNRAHYTVSFYFQYNWLSLTKLNMNYASSKVKLFKINISHRLLVLNSILYEAVQYLLIGKLVFYS